MTNSNMIPWGGSKRGLVCGRLILLLLLVVGSAYSATAATSVVQIVNFQFQPKFLTISPGDTVLWTNTTLTGHNVVSSNSVWAAPPLFTSPGTFSLKFSNSGTYGYFCSPHHSFGMVGVVTVQAANQPPTVAITNPASGSILAAPATITLMASATDSDGTVAEVQFYSGATLLGSDTTRPYSFVVGNLGAGSYTFSARAVDNLGLSSPSASVNVSVVDPVASSFDANPGVSQGLFTFKLAVTPGLRYALDYTTDLANWSTLTNFQATSSSMTFSFPTTGFDRRFFQSRLLPNP